MKFYKVSYIDHEDNCTWRLFTNKKDAEKFIKKDGREYGEVICTKPFLLVLQSTRKADILQLINGISY